MNQRAKELINFIDLTNLSDSLSEIELVEICKKCQSECYTVAALCVDRKYVKQCKGLLGLSHVKVATIFNFPFGDQDTSSVINEIRESISDGADEFDIVIPLNKMKNLNDLGIFKKCILEFVKEIRACVPNRILKFIISTDVLIDPVLIKVATESVILGGANFVKTCTGKTGSGVTMEALKNILEVINESKKKVGVKASGGVKTFQFANEIYELVQKFHGDTRLTLNDFRFGASSLLDDLLSQQQIKLNNE